MNRIYHFLANPSVLVRGRSPHGQVYDEYSRAMVGFSNLVESQHAQEKKFQGRLNLSVIFKLPFPDGTGAKRRQELEGKYHTNRPTLGMMLRALEELLTGTIVKDGGIIVSVVAEKRMSAEPGIEFVITEIE